MVTIRRFKDSDYDSVIEVLKDAELFDEVWESRENINGMVSKNPDAVLVAVDGEEVVGCIVTTEYGPKLHYLFRLVVKKDKRRQGIGTKLIEKAYENAERKGVNEVGMYVDSESRDLQSFYAKRGFKRSEKSYFYMWREL